MESKHTPGPWTIQKYYSNGCEAGPWIMAGPDSDGQRRIVASVGGAPYIDADRGATTYANARLIAAAPDLLVACRAALMMIDPFVHDVTEIEAAIAKAETGGAS